MILKSLLMSSALSLSVLSLSPLANAAGFEKRATIVGAEKTPASMANQVQEALVLKRDAALMAKDAVQKASGPSNSIARMVSADAKAVDFVAMSTKAHAALTGHGKPAEAPSSKGNSSGSAGSGVASNPIAARYDTNARAMEVVAMAGKAKAAKNNGGKPSDQPGSAGGSGGGSGSKGGGESSLVGSREMGVVGSAMKAKSEKANGDKPSEQPTPHSSSGSRGSARSSGGGGAGHFSGPGAMSPSFRGSPGERSASHCNAHGMCF
jgi:hypothetical protein